MNNDIHKFCGYLFIKKNILKEKRENYIMEI